MSSNPNGDTPPEDTGGWRSARARRAEERASRAQQRIKALMAPSPLPEGDFPQGRVATGNETLAEISMIAMLRPRNMHDWEMIRGAKVECLRYLALHHGLIQERAWKLPPDLKGLKDYYSKEYERITGKKPEPVAEEDTWTKPSEEPRSAPNTSTTDESESS